MEFRPCIDVHNGKVKQIVGGSLRDAGDTAKENFVSEKDGAYYAGLYRKYGLPNGHVIMLNPASSPCYSATKEQALSALKAWPGGLQIGGGINPDNAPFFLRSGASHVIVTSFVFRNGTISRERLQALQKAVGKEHLVLDLSCRKRDGRYYIVTDRWQKFTSTEVTPENLAQLSSECDEFLIHAADVEGKAAGIDADLVRILATLQGFPVTYAGGVGSFDDLALLKKEGHDHLNVTIGSALDLFGGNMPFDEVLAFCRRKI